mgnify:CR=1 FL=1
MHSNNKGALKGRQTIAQGVEAKLHALGLGHRGRGCVRSCFSFFRAFVMELLICSAVLGTAV